MFAAETINGGLSAHIVAWSLGHANINVTHACLAAFDKELVRTYQAFLARRRSTGHKQNTA